MSVVRVCRWSSRRLTWFIFTPCGRIICERIDSSNLDIHAARTAAVAGAAAKTWQMPISKVRKYSAYRLNAACMVYYGIRYVIYNSGTGTFNGYVQRSFRKPAMHFRCKYYAYLALAIRYRGHWRAIRSGVSQVSNPKSSQFPKEQETEFFYNCTRAVELKDKNPTVVIFSCIYVYYKCIILQ